MSTTAGDGIVIITLSVVLGIVGYHVIGWWAPGLIIGSYVAGTILNTLLQRLQRNAAADFDEVMRKFKGR